VQAAITDMLKTAEAAVNEAGLADDLRPWGFLAAAVVQSGFTGWASEPVPGRTSASPLAVAGEGPLDALASRLAVDRETVESAFYLDDEGRPQLGLARGKLGRRKAEAARQVALLCSVARQ